REGTPRAGQGARHGGFEPGAFFSRRLAPARARRAFARRMRICARAGEGIWGQASPRLRSRWRGHLGSDEPAPALALARTSLFLGETSESELSSYSTTYGSRALLRSVKARSRRVSSRESTVMRVL